METKIVKWEYYLVDLYTEPYRWDIRLDIQGRLDRYGDFGWELCGTEYGCFIFKRQKGEGNHGLRS